MATKRQREFKKQMKQLDKEGKLPNGYYARRRITYTGGGMSILFIIFLLWRFGIFSMVFSAFLGLFAITQGNQYIENMGSQYVESAENTEYIAYSDAVADVDTLISDVYLDIYKHFYENKTIGEDVFVTYQEDVAAAVEKVETEQKFLVDLAENYKEDLGVSSDMLDFAIAHYKGTLNEQDKRYLDTLSKKSQDLYDKRLELWDNAWYEINP